MKIGNQYYWYHNDHLGTPQVMTTGSGAVVWSAKYSSFGKAVVDPSSTVVNPLRFAGQYFDAETGLHYNYHRYYDPSTGRYLTPDPIGLAGGINLFAYTENNPINWIDPLGLDRYVIVVGDPGLGHHNVGSNFSRAAQTRADQLRSSGHTVDVTSISNVTQFNTAITSGSTIDGGVIYYGHGWNGVLYIGETSDPGTNLDSSNISSLSNSNLGASATVELNSCNSGTGGTSSIAQSVATQLDRQTSGWNRPLGFTNSPGVYLHGVGTLPPATGPLYVTPTPGGTSVTYSP